MTDISQKYDLEEVIINIRKLMDLLDLQFSPILLSISPHIVQNNTNITDPVCKIVQKVRRGKKIIINEFNYQSCFGGAYNLGLIKKPEWQSKFSINEARLFKDEDAVNNHHKLFKHISGPVKKSYIFYPIDMCESIPSVIVMICNPKQAMRISGLSAYSTGIPPRFYGFSCLCRSVIAEPLITKKIGISLIDPLARQFGQYEDEELVVGIPIEELQNIIKNIDFSICGTAKRELKRVFP